MKNYKRLFKISMVLTSLGIFFMTMMIFIVLVYSKDMDDVMKNSFSKIFLRYPMWLILAIASFIPGLSGMVYATKLQRIAKEEALKID